MGYGETGRRDPHLPRGPALRAPVAAEAACRHAAQAYGLVGALAAATGVTTWLVSAAPGEPPDRATAADARTAAAPSITSAR